MDKATDSKPAKKKRKRRGRGVNRSRLRVDEDRVLEIDVPEGSRFKGYEDYIVQDLIIRPYVVRYRRKCWVTPDGRAVIAPLPDGITGHFGAELQRFVLAQYYRGQVTIPRITRLLHDIGVDISERQIRRFFNKRREEFTSEARDVLRAGLETACWISVDDTGARHKAKNGVCTQIGNDFFAWFGTTFLKSRLNFLSLLRAGHEDYVINDAALDYMRQHTLSNRVIDLLANDSVHLFSSENAWMTQLEKLGITSRIPSFLDDP